ncbi:ATP-binding cassette domain-containing protein [Nannocystis sp.]|uniref:ATP-binding cassette domain-containing protein n=1 Tax=Nannocystis sp. TaxID=1962667 RepID=UPI0025F90B88|nr:ATP-binding cassette domain-containing protein [Nannocystis sp.]MBK7828840.1 ATP-binding cassette domain-containing protein [Nannocystis sp.]
MTASWRVFARKTPFVQQMEAVECGAASLTMVLRHFGHHAELAEVREVAGVSRDGVTAKSIVHAARHYGLVPRARKLEPEALAGVSGPAILHWEMNHFVVFDRWTARGVRILDPGVGPRLVSFADFDLSFTGVCIEFTPGADFVAKPQRRAALERYLALLRGAPSALVLLALASLLLNAFGLGLPVATQVIVDRVLGHDQWSWLPIVGAAALALIAAQMVVGVSRAVLLARLRAHLDVEIGASFVQHLLSLPMRVFSQRSTADLIGRVQGIGRVREMLAGAAVTLVVDGVLMLSYLALIVIYEWRLGLVVVAGLALYVVSFAVARPRQLERFRERNVKDIKRDVELYQALRGILTLKSAGREQGAYERWQQKSGHADVAGVREAQGQDVVTVVLHIIRAVLPAIMLLAGAHFVITGALTLGAFLGVLFLQGLIFEPLERLIQTLLAAQELPVHLERIDDILLTAPESPGGRPCPPLEGRITFENVSFRYGPTSPLTLDNVSFTVDRGEKIALVGPSGSGKSTIGRLLTGLYRPSSGRILLDGHDLAELDLATARRQLGVVLQETAIFDGTVAENIALYHRGAPLAAIVEAARVAQIHEDVEALPQGYDTRISASSCPLSGGQQQRLALARAVMHRPAIMLLDEATSALDSVTESAIEQFLASRLCTRIVIAHRLSTVRDADRILVLSQGRVVEQGRHAELGARGGLYAELARKADSRKKESVVANPAAPARAVSAEDLARSALRASDEATRVSLAPYFVRRSFTAGATIVHQGERGSGLFLVEEGELDVVLHEPGLRPFTMSHVGAGEIVGELSLLEGSSFISSVEARTTTRVLHLPQSDFEALRAAQDPAGAQLIMGLGQVIAGRLRAIDAQYATLGIAARRATTTEVDAKYGHEMAIAETSLGASLSSTECQDLEQMGTVMRLDAGTAIFRRGDPGDRLFLVLRGRLAIAEEGRATPQVTRPGELLGEDSFFDLGGRTEQCEAIEPVTVLAIDNDRLRDLLLTGGEVGWKLLRHLVQSLVGDFRMATLRLREAVAGKGNEAALARAARQHAERRAHEEDAALAALPSHRGRVPVVRESDPQLAGAACVTAMLRHHQRPIRLQAVVEACREHGTISARSLAAGAKSLGMIVRRIGASASELRMLDHPLIVATRAGGYVVVERARRGRVSLMDPARGRVSLSHGEAIATLTDECLELSPEEHAGSRPTLGDRLASLIRQRRHAIVLVAVATLIVQVATLAVPMTTAYVIGGALPAGDGEVLSVVALVLVTVLASQALASFVRSRAVLYLRTHVDRGLLQQLLRHVLGLPVVFFEQHPPGEIVQHFAALRLLRTLLGTEGIAVLLDLPMLVIGGAYLLWLDSALLGVIAGAVAAFLLVFAFVLPRLRTMATDQYALASRGRNLLIEVLAGLPTLRLTGDRDAGARAWLPVFRQEQRLSARQDFLTSVQRSSLAFIRYSAIAAALWWGTARVLAGTLSLGALMAFLAMATTFLAALEGVMAYLSSLLRADVALAKLKDAFAEPLEQSGERVAPPGKLSGRVTLDGVSFGYTKDGPRVLRNVSLSIAAGSKVAIVGGSGAGKSTLGRLLLGFYMPDTGRILYDGRDLGAIDVTRLRNQFGVVMQESFLFAGSLRENLTLGSPGVGLDALTAAAKKAAIHEDIEAMPMKYETIVSEGGGSLSGGQRQRISLARALVHDPAILLLDEATSALDSLTQHAIEAQLKELSCTRIVIAHRLSTVIDADQIIVMDRGEIVEIGRHDALMQRRGMYHRLVEAQL